MLYEPIGEYSKSAYYIPELSANVHCFEELAYIVRGKIYDVGDFIMKDDVLYFRAENSNFPRKSGTW